MLIKISSPADLSQLIDHTILRTEANQQDIIRLCREAEVHGFYSVCVNPGWIEIARKNLIPKIKVTSVVGFPLGASSTTTKKYEAQDDINRGADEIDMVMNVGRFKDAEHSYVQDEIAGVVEAAKGHIVKVIIETCLLTDDEKVIAANIIKEAGAHFVKTSTGFNVKGADPFDVALLRKTVGPDFGVKASGGIRDYKTCRQMIEAGANRIGTSASVKIIEEVLASIHQTGIQPLNK